jgi:tetratricopeptide (TPR) repeat protein
MMEPVLDRIEQLLVSRQAGDAWQAVDIYIKLGHIDRALQTASEIVQQDSSQQQIFRTKYPEIIRLGAEFAEEICDYPKAVYYWEQLLQQQPQMVDAWYGLALAKANLGEISDAKRAIDRSLQIDPRHSLSQRLLENLHNSSRN